MPHAFDAVEDAELFLYPGDQHLFSDRSLSAYDEGATTLLPDPKEPHSPRTLRCEGVDPPAP